MARHRPHIRHHEEHRLSRTGWLRAAVLGANDGILSTASLILGVATATQSREGVLVAGVSGLLAGALSMAAGEYVSVSSQADAEKADLARERGELADNAPAELRELAGIYEKRGLDPELAHRVAEQLTAHDALAAHARDELGITEELMARPLQAAFSSAAAFSAGAVLPLLPAYFAPFQYAVPAIYGTALVFLLLLGALGAFAGGASQWKGAMRVLVWGALAMAVTAGLGRLFHVQL
jgi:VIT1/CCC1 family predicted Fe2+/Mn2+ transporter